MRTETEMFDLIVGIANADERIRAVYMNGSRANPNVEKDKYQDYDIVYIVNQIEPFLTDKCWISVFGEFAIVQEPNAPNLGWGTKHDFTKSCCNEFWWRLNNVAKGIARKQLPYAMRMYTAVVHIELEKMIEWYIGINTDFSVAMGMWGKYFAKYLPIELYTQYKDIC